MIRQPIVLALGQGFVTPAGQELYEKLKHIAEFHWYHSPLTGESWPSTLRKFTEKYRRPLILLVYGPQVGRVDQTLLDSLVPGLRLVASAGAGFDNVDVDYCTENLIWVSNTPDSVTDSTANCAVWLALTCVRNFISSYESAKVGAWRDDMRPGARDPSGLNMGVVGLGRIGSSVARKSKAFGMNIFYHARHRASDKIERDSGEAQYVASLKDLVSQCDIVSVHVPLSDATVHLFDAKVFDQFKSGSVFINTARGKVHDEHALIEALRRGKVGMAGLDVFEDEPNISDAFLKFGDLSDRVITTPHIGAATKQARRKMELELLENIRGVLEHDKPRNPVNKPRD